MGEVGGFDAAEDAVSVAHTALAVIDLLQAWIDVFARLGAGGAAGDG